MKSSVKIFIFISLFCLTTSLFAQTFYSQRFSINDGLPSNCITVIFKDSRGLLWIGTDAGLCLLNDKNFKVFNTSNGLLTNNVTSVTEDTKGNLWIGCMGGGISQYDGTQFKNFSKKEGLISVDVRKVWYSKKFNLLFIGTNDGCSVFDGNRFYSFSASQAHAQFNKLFVCGFLEGSDHVNIYAVLCSNPIKFYPKGRKFELNGGLYSSKPSSSMAPFILKNGDTIFGNERKGIVVSNGIHTKPFIGIGQVFNTSQDESEDVWIAGWADQNDRKDFYGGLFKFDGHKVESVGLKFGITDRSVWTVFYDSIFNVLWVGTQNEGLFRIPTPAFAYYKASYFNLPYLSVNDLLVHDGSLWIANKGYLIRMESSGLYRSYDLKRYTVINKEQFSDIFRKTHAYLFDPEGSYGKYQQLILQGRYDYPNPYLQIMEDLDSKLILLDRSLYHPSEYQTILNSEISQRSSLPPTVFHLGKDSQGGLYFSDRFGLKRVEPHHNQFSFSAIPTLMSVENFIFSQDDTLYHTGEANKSLYCASVEPEFKYPIRCRYPIPNVIQMIANRDELLLASRTQGLFRLRKGVVEAFSQIDPSLPKTIYCMCLDQRGSIVAGSSGAEIFLITEEKNRLRQIRRISETDGLVGNVIRWLVTDRNNRLYAGTNLGLLVIDLDDAYGKGEIGVRFFNHDQGFTDCSGKVAALDQNGDIWVGTDQQLVRINPRILERLSTIKPNLRIKSLDVNIVPFPTTPKQGTEGWHLEPQNNYQFEYSQNTITFHFESINYLSPDQTLFRYRLTGLDSSWTNFTNDPKAVFTSLPAGHFNLRIEYYNRINNLMVGSKEYSFSIATPYYKTWWFITLIVLVTLLITWTLYLYRIKEIRRQEHQKSELQKELANTEMRALQAQMKPHFIFNAINSIQTYILDNDTDQALFYLTMFSKLIRKTLENASKEFITLSEELEYLRSYIELEKMRFEGLFDFDEKIHPQIIAESILIPPMIIQPFVENAIKHGLRHKKKNGNLVIEVLPIESIYYKIKIKDNGVGRGISATFKLDALSTHQSKGTQIVSDRLTLLNEKQGTDLYRFEFIDLFDQIGNPSGTCVEITFPVINF